MGSCPTDTTVMWPAAFSRRCTRSTRRQKPCFATWPMPCAKSTEFPTTLTCEKPRQERNGPRDSADQRRRWAGRHWQSSGGRTLPRVRGTVLEGSRAASAQAPRRTGAAVTQAGSEIAANSGRWVKLTQESAQLVKKYGLRDSAKTGLSTGVIKGQKGQVAGFVQFVKGPGAL